VDDIAVRAYACACRATKPKATRASNTMRSDWGAAPKVWLNAATSCGPAANASKSLRSTPLLSAPAAHSPAHTCRMGSGVTDGSGIDFFPLYGLTLAVSRAQ